MPPCCAHVGIISPEDEAAIRRGLEAIAARIEAGEFPWDEGLEDIHMNIEARLTEAIGEAGKRLHTARSRNDQVALDLRLWVRDAIDGLSEQVRDAMRALAARAEEHAGNGDAGLHPSPAGAAGDPRPPPARLCGDAGARPRPASRIAARG